MKIKAYAQLLESYRSYMADAFGVTEEYMDTELCCAGLLLVVVCMPRLIRLEALW